MEIPDTPSVSIAGAISIDAWINPTTTVAFQTILSKYDSPANQLSYILGVNAGGGLRFVVTKPETVPYRAVLTRLADLSPQALSLTWLRHSSGNPGD